MVQTQAPIDSSLVMSIIAAYRDLSDSARRHMSTQPTGCGSTGGITDRVVPTYKVVPIESTAPRRTIVRTCVDAANRSGLGTLSNRAETEPPFSATHEGARLGMR